jgi:hypothetical protein
VDNYKDNLDAFAVRQVIADWLPTEVDKCQLSTGQKEAFIRNYEKWRIVADWLDYFICPEPNKPEPPGSRARSSVYRNSYKDYKCLAMMLAERFRLCTKIAELTNIRPYKDYANLWISTIWEDQDSEVRKILQPVDELSLKKSGKSKNHPGMINVHKQALEQLRNSEIPSDYFSDQEKDIADPRTQHIFNFYDLAISIVKDGNIDTDFEFEYDYWDPYQRILIYASPFSRPTSTHHHSL